MKIKFIFPLLTLSLCGWSCASPSTTLEERAPVAASVFYWELDQAEKELSALRAHYQEASYSADALGIFDSMANDIQADIRQARYNMTRFDAQPDVQILHQVGDDTLALYDDISDLRTLSYSKR